MPPYTPNKSKAQQRLMFAMANRGEISMEDAKGKARATDQKHLPEHVEKKASLGDWILKTASLAGAGAGIGAILGAVGAGALGSRIAGGAAHDVAVSDADTRDALIRQKAMSGDLDYLLNGDGLIRDLNSGDLRRVAIPAEVAKARLLGGAAGAIPGAGLGAMIGRSIGKHLDERKKK